MRSVADKEHVVQGKKPWAWRSKRAGTVVALAGTVGMTWVLPPPATVDAYPVDANRDQCGPLLDVHVVGLNEGQIVSAARMWEGRIDDYVGDAPIRIDRGSGVPTRVYSAPVGGPGLGICTSAPTTVGPSGLIYMPAGWANNSPALVQHEFGHVLGLMHTGNSDSPDGEKPVMAALPNPAQPLTRDDCSAAAHFMRRIRKADNLKIGPAYCNFGFESALYGWSTLAGSPSYTDQVARSGYKAGTLPPGAGISQTARLAALRHTPDGDNYWAVVRPSFSYKKGAVTGGTVSHEVQTSRIFYGNQSCNALALGCSWPVNQNAHSHPDGGWYNYNSLSNAGFVSRQWFQCSGGAAAQWMDCLSSSAVVLEGYAFQYKGMIRNNFSGGNQINIDQVDGRVYYA